MNRRKTPIPFPETGGQIRYYRHLRGYTAAQLSQYIDIDSKYLSNLESGNQMPSISVLYRIAKALNVSIEQLILRSSEQDDSNIRTQIIADIENYTDDELQLIHNLMCNVIPYIRKIDRE